MTTASVFLDTAMPFPAGTGRGLNIAVIDSGVNTAHPHICAVTQRVAFGSEEEASFDDVLGHGTAVTAAIQEKAPDAHYYMLKLFGSTLRTSSSRLMQAIEWTIANRMDIVNLSLGTPNLDYRADMRALVERASTAGAILVAARQAGETPVLPGMLEGVIGVDVDWSLPRHSYRIGDENGSPRFFASGFPRSLPGIPPARNLSGISFAVANLTGVIARGCERLEHRSVDSVYRLLAGDSLSKQPS